MIDKIVNKVKGWWKQMFDYKKIINDFNLDTQTSKEMLDAIQKWSQIFNMHEPWIDETTTSLHVAKTMCEKVAKAVTIESKITCDEPYIDGILQKFLRNKRKNTEYMIGKSCIFFRPYFDGTGISISSIQADNLIPVEFNGDGDLTACILIDQIKDGTTIYTRLEYDKLVDNTMTIQNIAYKGRTDGVVLGSKIPLTMVEKWKDIKETSTIEGIDRLIGGFATMNTSNSIDNSSPLGVPIYFNAISTLKDIDMQYSRILWEYEGSELALDIDESMLEPNKKGGLNIPARKRRLFRKFEFEDTGSSGYNVFSPAIRDTSLFNGLNEMLRQAENECGLAYGTLSKAETIEKTATEIKSAKQDYYVTVADIQFSLQKAIEDLVYGIYVLCKLYGIPVKNDYVVECDWDDSILVDKDSSRNQSLLEMNNEIISQVQYLIETRNMKEKEAIEFIKKQQEYKKLTEEEKEEETKKEPEEE